MRREEARWIRQTIEEAIVSTQISITPVALNLGSGSRQAREENKPFIDSETLDPLRKRGFQIVHSDLKADDGVDLVGDIFDPEFQGQLKALKPEVIFFCNVLEHLPTELRLKAPSILKAIIAPGGYLFVTVPYSYPYHADPIDTMYRPSPEELIVTFSEMVALRTAIVESDSYGAEFFRSSLNRKLRKLLRLCFPFVRPKRWLSHAHRFLWLSRPYKITAGLFQALPKQKQ